MRCLIPNPYPAGGGAEPADGARPPTGSPRGSTTWRSRAAWPSATSPFRATPGPTVVIFSREGDHGLRACGERRGGDHRAGPALERRDIKSVALLAQVLAKQAAVRPASPRPGSWRTGTVAEGSSSTAWASSLRADSDQRALSHAVLPGVTRLAVSGLPARRGSRVEERPFRRRGGQHGGRGVFTQRVVVRRAGRDHDRRPGRSATAGRVRSTRPIARALFRDGARRLGLPSRGGDFPSDGLFPEQNSRPAWLLQEPC